MTINNTTDSFITKLNDKQLEAVETTDGPLLVLAGAGTGKTKVLTSRIAYLIEYGFAAPSQILAVTFTNKAAMEMRERVNQMAPADGIWLGTFHSIATKILRYNGGVVGLSPNFVIINTDDQIRLVKNIIKEESIDDKKFPPKIILSIIQRWKDMSLAAEMVSDADMSSPAHHIAKAVYKLYQQKLGILDAVDFGDLLLLNIKLFTEHPDILASYQQRLQYILVDEYQDTNVAQYIWLRMLAQKNKNICCVGDEDQSIYGWRGAEIGNILRFEKDFPGSKIIKLEQNYRSTNNILNAASKLISNNNNRIGKTLWTDIGEGEKITITSSMDERDEASQVYKHLQELKRKNLDFKDIAILVRASFQTRAFEECFIANGLPYKVIGGLRFYERLEIRDIISYIRASVNHDDSLAYERIINTPKRSIGTTTINKIYDFANRNSISLFKATKAMLESKMFASKTHIALAELIELFEKWHQRFKEDEHTSVIKLILEESGYLEMWKNDKSIEAQGRIENINELLQTMPDFSCIQEFLEHVSLISTNDAAQSENMVSIMTIHSAKGLEFSAVFLPGFEEGIFPHQKSIDESGLDGLEEERRLAYVAITRARKKLYISSAKTRRVYGQWQSSVASRFINELPNETKHEIDSYRSSIQQSDNFFIERRNNLSKDKYQVGTKVSHKKFGMGKIVNKSGDFLDIIFESHGIKKILKSFIELNHT